MIQIFVITIDSGTTNSRIRLIDEKSKKCVKIKKIEVGVRNTSIDGNNLLLKKELAQGINKMINETDLTVDQVSYIVASGMITSNLGLYELPHIEAPASISDLAHHTKNVQIDGFPNIPCYFIPGIKSTGVKEGAYIKNYDVMRGEEAESFGLLEKMQIKGNGVIILPGSHNKFVFIKEGKIDHSFTTLSGELLSVVSTKTILSSSLDDALISKMDVDFLMNGYHDAMNLGLTRALFQVRLLELFGESTREERANYLVGSVIASDLQYLNDSILGSLDWILIGGSEQLRSAFCAIVEKKNYGLKIIKASNKEVENSTVIGALSIMEVFLSENKNHLERN